MKQLRLQSVTKTKNINILDIIIYMKHKENIIILFIWLVVVILGCFYHELWRDETQVWCIVRDLNFFEIFQVTRIEGHPMFWYLLILPFAKLGFPMEIIQVISVGFVFASLAFLLYKSPFNILQKVLISFSAGMVYFLPVISRNYALIPIFLFLLAHFYNQRKEKPYIYALLLFLLSQTHILMFGFCGILFFLFSIEQIKNKKALPAIFLLLFNFLFLFLSFYQADSVNEAVQVYRERELSFFKLLDYFSYIFFNPVFKYSVLGKCIAFYGILLVVFCSLFKQDKKIFLVFATSFCYIFYIFAKVWFGGVSYQKAFVLTLILIFCVWVTGNIDKKLRLAFNLFLGLSVILAVSHLYLEIRYQFSGSKQVVDFIKENIKDEIIIFKGYTCTISPLSAYLPQKRFYSLDKNKYITYYHFQKNDDMQKEEFPSNAKYYIVQEDSFLFEELGYKLMFSSDENIVGPVGESEVYKIYEKI